MASNSNSGQKFISRNRKPRVHITYEDPYDAERLVELPFVMGVMADLSGNNSAVNGHNSTPMGHVLEPRTCAKRCSPSRRMPMRCSESSPTGCRAAILRRATKSPMTATSPIAKTQRFRELPARQARNPGTVRQKTAEM